MNRSTSGDKSVSMTKALESPSLKRVLVSKDQVGRERRIPDDRHDQLRNVIAIHVALEMSVGKAQLARGAAEVRRTDEGEGDAGSRQVKLVDIAFEVIYAITGFQSPQPERVRTLAADERVGTGSPIEHVIAPKPRQHVVHLIAKQEVTLRAADRILDHGAIGYRDVVFRSHPQVRNACFKRHLACKEIPENDLRLIDVWLSQYRDAARNAYGTNLRLGASVDGCSAR